MKKQWEQECADLRAELVALQKQIHAIETKLAGATGNAPTLSRGRMSKSKMMILLPVVVLLAAGGVLYGEGAIDALFIDQRGNVGVGTTTPQGFQVVLPETNKPSVPNAGISLAGGSEGNASMELRNNGKGTPYIDFAQSTDKDFDARIRLTDKDKLAIEGANVGIGTQKPEAKLDVAGSLKATSIDVRGRVQAQLLAFLDEKGEEYKDNWIGMADNVLDDKTKWLHIGGITDGADNNKQRRIALYANTTYIDGNVGIWTKEPKARLDVNGDIKATSIKGTLAFSNQKVCSPVVGNAWRDTIIVPATWTKDTCNNYRAQVGAASYNLACIFADSYSFGADNGGLPSQNCGW